MQQSYILVGPSKGGMPQTGAAAGATAVIAALKGFVNIITTTLGDRETAAVMQSTSTGSPVFSNSALGGAVSAHDAVSALQQLQQLSVRAADYKQLPQAEQATKQSVKSTTLPGNVPHTAAQNGATSAVQQQQEQPAASPPHSPGSSLVVCRDAEWVEASSSRVQTLLAMCLPPLMSHPRPSVRQALAEGMWHMMATMNGEAVYGGCWLNIVAC